LISLVLPMPNGRLTTNIYNFITMHSNLKQLQQYKGSKKEYSFLTPVSEYISEHYGEIMDVLDVSNVKEILNEIRDLTNNEDYYNSFITYVDPEALCSHPSHMALDTKEEDGKELKGLSNITKRNYPGDSVSFDEVYYVNDYKAYDEYNKNLEIERREATLAAEAKRLAVRRENEDARQKRDNDDLKLREKFGLKRNADTDRARLFESIFQTDKLEDRYNAFSKLINMSEVERSEIYDIAREEAREVVYDHECEEH